MIYGHDDASMHLDFLLQQLYRGGQTPSFVLLVGPDHIGKWSLLRDRVSKSNIVSADQCVLHDASGYDDYLNKTHTIKIQTSEAGKIPTCINRYQQVVPDYGIRELQSRLALAPVQTCKLVLMHNIHRLTSASANAMLKILEEPWSHRMIVATTDSLSMLLPTIVSRAQCITMHTAHISVILQYLQDHYSHLDLKLQQAISQMSGSTIGLCVDLANRLESDIVRYYRDCQTIAHASTLQIYQILQSYVHDDQLVWYLTLLQSYTDYHGLYHQMSVIADYHRLVQASIHSDNALLLLSNHLSGRG
jgi:DNA polymerase III delta prime subunit